jgi:hypothetical protein
MRCSRPRASPGVVVLAAPAGSGKTTAAAHLAGEIDAAVVWYRLGTSDAQLSVSCCVICWWRWRSVADVPGTRW